MSDETERIPEPGNNGEESPFDFNALTVESTEPIADFEAPNVNGTKPKWWERKPKSSSQRKSKTRKPPPPMPRGGLKPALENLYTGIGMSVMPFDPSCGRIIIENAASCAAALDELAKTNPAVRRLLITLVTTSAYGAVIMAHAPIIMAIAMHHVPALRERQEKMVGEFAEAFANGFGTTEPGDERK